VSGTIRTTSPRKEQFLNVPERSGLMSDTALLELI
jgi:hypothetical protein